MMLGTEASKKTMSFLGKTMYQQFKSQQEAGRLPQDIHCELVEPNKKISRIIRGIRDEASTEVTPTI